MGCDIHVHTEIKLDGVWEHYGSPDVARCYPLFEKMAGVRGAGEKAISLPKGMPSDASKMTQFECDFFGSDGHSHSWLSSQEIEVLYEWWVDRVKAESSRVNEWGWLERQFGYLLGNAWLKEDISDRAAGRVTDFRWVFWFDN